MGDHAERRRNHRRAGTGVDTGIRFITPDAHAAHARLSDLGLRVGALLDWPTAPLMFEFWDLDENTMYVTEPD